MEESKVPFVAFSNADLDRLPPAAEGDFVDCPNCGEKHELICATTAGTGEKSDLMFYKCGDKTYLGALAGKRL